MGLTLTEKIIKAHIIDGEMVKGTEIGLKIDQTLTQDATGTMAYLQFEAMGVDRVKTERSVAYIDHNTLQSGFENADDHRFIGSVAKKHGILFHTDAVQAFAHIPMNVDEMNIDLLSASGHKFNGPKGIGIMYIRTGVKIRSFIHGGAQERKRRAGTENVPGIVGIGTAAKRAAANMEERTAKEREVRDYLIDRVLNEIPYCRLNGHRTDRLPNNANFSFQFVEGESLLIKLDMKGICGSSGSACTSGSLDPSHVLLAIGLPHEIAHGSLRLTLNEEIEKEDIDYVVDNLKEIVAHLREMSPLYEDFIKKQKKQGEK